MIKYLALLAIGVVVLRAELQFSGFFQTPKESLYSLSDTENNVSSGWLKIGQSFRGYTVVSFDREREVITLKKAEQSLELHLRESKVKDGKMTISGIITLGLGEQLGGVRASIFLGEETVFPLKDGVTLHLTAKRLPDGNMLFRSRFVLRQKDGTEKIESAPTVTTRPGQPFAVRVGELGYQFTP